MVEGLTPRGFIKWLGKDVIGHNSGLRGAIEQGHRVWTERKGQGLRRGAYTAGAVVGGEAVDFMLPATYRNAVYNQGHRGRQALLAVPALALDGATIGVAVAVGVATGPFAPATALWTKVEGNAVENLFLDAIGRAPLRQE